MNQSYSHLSLEERERLSVLLAQGHSLRSIGKTLGRSHHTLSRELQRNKRAGQEYIPCKAHTKSEEREIYQRRKAPLKNHEIYLYVRRRLRDDFWSPETIAGRLPIDIPGQSITHETIYRYIFNRGKRHRLWRYLAKHHKKRRVKSGRRVQLTHAVNRIPGAISIEKRSKRAQMRQQVGHIESDLMEGSRTTKTALSVEVERKTRYTKLSKVKNKTAHEKQKVLQSITKTLQSVEKSNKPVVRSWTLDGGSENTCHDEVTKETEVPVYFCHPYHSWEKGTVENTIGRVRLFFPKGKSLHDVLNTTIQWVENKMNNTPRKCLDFKTPNEMMEQEVNKYKFRKYLKTLQVKAGGALQCRM